MDKLSKALDESYRSIQVDEKQAEVHRQVIAMLEETGVTSPAIEEQVKHHAEAIRKLQEEIVQKKLRLVDDLMLLEDANIIAVMKMRYLDYMRWEDICEKIDRQRRWAMKMRDTGLSTILRKRRDP